MAYPVSQSFKDIVTRQTVPRYVPHVTLNGSTIVPMSMTFSDNRETLIGGFSAKQMTFEFDGSTPINFKDGELVVSLGFDELEEQCLIGTFYVDNEDIEFDEVKKIYKVVTYDRAIKFDIPFDHSLNIHYDEGGEFIYTISQEMGVPINLGSLDRLDPVSIAGLNINSSDNIPYRDVLSKYAQMSFGMFRVGRDNVIVGIVYNFSANNVIPEIVDAHDYFSLKIDKDAKPINSVVYNPGSGDVEDPIIWENSALVERDGRVEFKYSGNYIMDFHSRERMVDLHTHNIDYHFPDETIYPFEAECVIYPWLDTGDVIYIKDIDGIQYRTIVQNIEWTWNGGLRGTMSNKVLPETLSDYTLSAEEKRYFEMGVKVNRVDEKITSTIHRIDDTDERLVKIEQDSESIRLEVSNIQVGGRNLLLKSNELFTAQDGNIRWSNFQGKKWSEI